MPDTKAPRRGKQGGRNRFGVVMYFEDGFTWRYESLPGSNPTIAQVRAGLTEALDHLTRFFEKKS